MYLIEAIKQAQAEYPCEYSDSDMLIWCDEVSARLITEDRTAYREIRPPIAADGTALLPEGVRAEQICKVYRGKREIPLRDLRAKTWRQFSEPSPRLAASQCLAPPLTIIYEAPYEPVRLTKYKGGISIDEAANELYIDDCEFIPGDILNVTIGDTKAEHINLLQVEYDPDKERGFILTVGRGELSGLPETANKDVLIEREITDKTVCDAPYDKMYVSYIIARVAQCQHDDDMCDRYMQEFNEILQRYKGWLNSRIPQEPIRFKNYW